MERLKRLIATLIRDKKSKVGNLKEIIDIPFAYEPIPFKYSNVGSYKR